ncbi:MAG: PAS domain-containing protein [Robiginitomaculum sp.]|nr:PAS domain-containing protein [Robiginitomaculum sp.]
MLAGNALRHQMILPQQQYVYDYWRSKCQVGRLPCRSDIDPADICEHLPMISVIEICDMAEQTRFKYRLAGTGFWEMFDAEISGQYIDQLPIGNRREYWHRVLSRVLELRRPSAGVTKPGTPMRGHLAQFWIRLPLSDDGVNVTSILGFDHLVKYSELEQYIDVPERITA